MGFLSGTNWNWSSPWRVRPKAVRSREARLVEGRFQENRLVSISVHYFGDQEILSPKSLRMNPDLGSGRSISYEAHFKHALIQMETGRKTADSPVLREKPLISPRNVSDGERTRPRI